MDLKHKHLTWASTVLVAIALLVGGGANLAGVPLMHQSFAELGLPVWFGYLVGALEVAGAIALFFPPLSALAAAGLVLIMVGAIYYHLVARHPAEGLPALVILLLCVYIFWRRRSSALVFR